MNNTVGKCTENTFGNEILISMKLLKLEENIFESDALMLSFQEEWADYIKKLERRIEKLKKMIDTGVPIRNWGIVTKNGKTYYIRYTCLERGKVILK